MVDVDQESIGDTLHYRITGLDGSLNMAETYDVLRDLRERLSPQYTETTYEESTFYGAHEIKVSFEPTRRILEQELWDAERNVRRFKTLLAQCKADEAKRSKEAKKAAKKIAALKKGKK